MNNNQAVNANVSLANTQPIKTESGKNLLLPGFVMRKVSKFLVGGEQDGLIPIQVFYDPETNLIFKSSVPPELHEELKDEIFE